MSINKYAQFFRDSGFFAGSKIKTVITDASYIGKEIILSKGTNVIQTLTIPVSGKVEFFTDESGELTISSNNGLAVIMTTVNVTNYATYNVTLHGMSSDNSRQIYADKNIVMSGNSTSVDIAYTGDLSTISARTSDTSLISVSVNENTIKIRDAGNEKSGKCTLTATVAASDKYDSADFTFNVNKTSGSIGDWATADDSVIARMVARADAGEINLNDYWHVGDKRKVSLKAITSNSNIIVNQPAQEIELVLMYDCFLDNKYTLTTPTASNRTRPSFVVGQRNCLSNLTPLEFTTLSDTITTSDGSTTKQLNLDSKLLVASGEASVFETYLNDNYFSALPVNLRTIFKNVNVRFCALQLAKENSPAQYANYGCIRTINSTKSQKVVLPSSYEICQDNATVEKVWRSNPSGDYLGIIGNSIYSGSGYTYFNTNDAYEDKLLSYAQSSFNYAYEGTLLSYYSTATNRIKYKGNTQEKCQYYTRTTADFNIDSVEPNNKTITKLTRGASIISISGTVISFNKENSSSTYGGIAPIMFI